MATFLRLASWQNQLKMIAHLKLPARGTIFLVYIFCFLVVLILNFGN